MWQPEDSSWRETWVQSTQYSDSSDRARNTQYSSNTDRDEATQYSDSTDRIQSTQQRDRTDNAETMLYSDRTDRAETAQYSSNTDRANATQYSDNADRAEATQYSDSSDRAKTTQYSDSANSVQSTVGAESKQCQLTQDSDTTDHSKSDRSLSKDRPQYSDRSLSKGGRPQYGDRSLSKDDILQCSDRSPYSDNTDHRWQVGTEAEYSKRLNCTEQLRPLSDPLISDTMSLYSSVYASSLPPYSTSVSTSRAWLQRTLLGLREDIVWLPTSCMVCLFW